MKKNLWSRIIRTIMPKIDETEPENGIIKEFQDKTKLFRLNRLLSDRRVVLCLALVLPVVILLTGNYLYNICTASLQAAFSVFQTEPAHISFGLENCFRFPSSAGYYVLIVLLILILEIVLPYKIRTSYKDFNVGQKGTERWATTEELRQQYVAVPEKDQFFDGAGGVPISWDRERNEILIDRSAVNNYIIGTTRSGKGESYLFTAIDIYSRASIKPSLIICDPKLEVYKMSSKTLRKRGFIPILLNLSDPLHTNGFDPIKPATTAWKQHDFATAELLVQSFCYSIFNADGAGPADDRFWTDSATNTLAALVLANIEDCLSLDEKLNALEYTRFRQRQSLYKQLSPDRQEAVRNGHAEMDFESILDERNTPIEDTVQWQPIVRHEKEISLYSIAVTFSTLTSVPYGQNKTALDAYFEKRPNTNKARLKYTAAHVAGDRTKGSIFSVMSTKLSVFMSEGIAKMTSFSDFDLLDVGFGKQPYAIFISLPDYDLSNHFICTIFINQLYFILSKHCTEKTNTGKCTREVVFLLDEFGNLPPLQDIDHLCTVCLGRNIRFNLMVQSTSQLEILYGKKAQTILGNCGNKYFLSSGDRETRENFSRELGNQTVVNVNRSGSKLSLHKSFTEMYEEKPLMNQNELNHLHEGENVVHRIMTRHDLQGNDIFSAPIFNHGNSRFRYRLQYLTDSFPNLEDIPLESVPWPDTQQVELHTYDLDAHFDRLSAQEKAAQQREAQRQKQLQRKE